MKDRSKKRSAIRRNRDRAYGSDDDRQFGYYIRVLGAGRFDDVGSK